MFCMIQPDQNRSYAGRLLGKRNKDHQVGLNYHSPLVEFIQSRNGWMQSPVIRLWNFGYQPAPIKKIIGTLPPPLFSAIGSALDSLSVIADQSSTSLIKLSEAMGWNKAEERTIVSMATDECAHFEAETDLGLIHIDYVPSTQSRKRVAFNTCFAELWSMSKEDLLLRFADYDVPLPYSELDWLRVLISDVEAHFQNVTTQYLRLTFGSGQAARAVLAEVTTKKSFTAVGQICRVRMIDPRLAQLSPIRNYRPPIRNLTESAHIR